MADFVFNIAKGRVAEMANNGDDLRMLALTTGVSEAVGQDADTITALLATAAIEVTVTTWTNYLRATLAGEAMITDDTGNTNSADFTDFEWTAAVAGETVVAVVIFLFVTDDDDSIPLTYHDASFTTNGSNVTIQVPAGGFFTAS